MSRSPNIAPALLSLYLAQAPMTRAELPLNIDQLMVDGGAWQLVSSLAYYNSHHSSYHNSRPNSSAAFGRMERSGQLTAALRYGVSPRVELNAEVRGGEHTRRGPGENWRGSFSGLGIGANWLLKAESASPAWLLEGRLELSSRFAGHQQTLPGGELALTAYQSLDPVVLSVSTSAAWRRSYTVGGRAVEPGCRLRITPQVNFAVNHRVTLIGGLAFDYRAADRVQGRSVGVAREDLRLRLGLGFRMRPQNTFFVTGDFASDEAGSGLSLQWFAAL